MEFSKGRHVYSRLEVFVCYLTKKQTNKLTTVDSHVSGQTVKEVLPIRIWEQKNNKPCLARTTEHVVTQA